MLVTFPQEQRGFLSPSSSLSHVSQWKQGAVQDPRTARLPGSTQPSQPARPSSICRVPKPLSLTCSNVSELIFSVLLCA